MCFNVPDFNKDPEAIDANWLEIYHIYLLEIEIETKRTLEMINDDIKSKGLTFDQKLKEFLLRFTNAR